MGTTYTFQLTTPLLYSNGLTTNPASATGSGYSLEMYERYPAGTTDPDYNLTTVAANGDIFLTGSKPYPAGFQVNGFDPHELEKVLTVNGSSNSVAEGVYGFGFTVTAHLPNNDGSVTSGQLVDAFDTPIFDVDNLGETMNENGTYTQTRASLFGRLQRGRRFDGDGARTGKPRLVASGAVAFGLLGLRRRPARSTSAVSAPG